MIVFQRLFSRIRGKIVLLISRTNKLETAYLEERDVGKEQSFGLKSPIKDAVLQSLVVGNG